MSKKIIGMLICVFLFSTLFPVYNTQEMKEIRNYVDQRNNSYDPLVGGWLEEIDGVTILHVSGGNYEMGYQHGYLLKDKIEQNYRAVLDSVSLDLYNMILEWWNNIFMFTMSEEYIEDLQGLADGSGKSFEEVVVFSLGCFLFILDTGCSEMVAWGPATDDGELYHCYSFDINEMIQDPVTGAYIHDNQVLILRDPDNGFASLSMILAGCIGGGGGINEKAISIGYESSPTFNETYYCVLPVIEIRKILDQANSTAEAIDILKGRQKGCGIVHVCDGKTPEGFVCEFTSDYFYLGNWYDPIENVYPFWQIDHVLRRKNMFINPVTASFQRDYYNPQFYFLLRMKKTIFPWFNIWRYYKTISNEIENIWGSINLDNTMDMIRSVYRGETDIYLYICRLLGIDKFPAYYQWVVCPKTGDIAISFAEEENFAQYGDVHHFNLFEILNSKPPS